MYPANKNIGIIETQIETQISWFETHNARGWSEEQPTVFDVRPWTVANHVFNIFIKPISTCKKDIVLL